jgi:hypothetical protein
LGLGLELGVQATSSLVLSAHSHLRSPRGCAERAAAADIDWSVVEAEEDAIDYNAELLSKYSGGYEVMSPYEDVGSGVGGIVLTQDAVPRAPAACFGFCVSEL